MKKLTDLGSVLMEHALLVALGVITTALFLFRLGSLPTPGLAPEEQSTIAASSNIHDVISSGFFLPLNVVRWGMIHVLPGHVNAAARFPSVLLALLTVAALVYIIRRWYKQRTMFFGLALVATSAWMLHIGRLATNDIAYLAAVPILIATHLLLYDYTERKAVIFVCAASFAVLMYVPGLIWLVLASVIWQRSEIKEALGELSVPLLAALAGLVLILLSPLAYSVVLHMHISYALAWLGLPGSLPSWREPLKNLAAAAGFVFVRTPYDPARWLGRLPLLDAFMTISFLAGAAFYLQHIRAERTKLLLLYGVLGILLCAAGGPVTRSILVPVIYLVAIGGIAFILHQWLHVFPRNPLARRLGIGLICAAIALSCLYNLRHYFVAWPHTKQTIQTFSRTV